MILITGNVEGKNCILLDNIIDSVETIIKAAIFSKNMRLFRFVLL
ncbi:alanine racemase [Rickettsia akari str. Hartford]|uniref:Alanine racemase n=1 Tax=Rickettsia akari (strain Hartford) TaxID=293614 RepID=A8GM52_RICAH|nr:alanine racemase [Rickettsia akari str. Hartford]